MLENSVCFRCSLLALLHEEVFDVWSDTTLGELSRGEDLVELIVVADSKLDVSWSDLFLLVFVGALSCEIEDLHGEVLEDGGEEDSSSDTDLSGVSALLEFSLASADWELETSLN